MTDRIIKDIRYYESDNENVDGKRMPQDLGGIFKPTNDTNYIGQRIARKLNELKFSYGEFDHIFINLTTSLKEDEILVSNRNIDKRIKYLDFGVNSTTFNSLNDLDKNTLLKSLTFILLKHISIGENLKFVNEVEQLILQFDTEIKISYKTKETNAFKIDIGYQIKPKDNSTRAIINYMDKKSNFCRQGYLNIQFYDDIYSLVDTISFADETITLKPKKSFVADVHNERYKTPLELKIADLEKINCH